MPKIRSCLWFDQQAAAAAALYTEIFPNSQMGGMSLYGPSGAKASGQKEGTVMTVTFRMANHEVMGLNGGPLFKFTPALSYFVWCDSEDEINRFWKTLSEGGEVRMGLDKYPWSERYGWTADRFGVEWQLILSPRKEKIAPAFLFVDSLFGKGEEALQFYLKTFKNSGIEQMSRDESGKSIQHCVFKLEGQAFALMEGAGKHGFEFSHAFSLMVSCDSQDEIDFFWNRLSDGGKEEPCGWLQDKFGVSWQIVPSAFEALVRNADKEKSERIMSALLRMKKPILKDLIRAAD